MLGDVGGGREGEGGRGRERAREINAPLEELSRIDCTVDRSDARRRCCVFAVIARILIVCHRLSQQISIDCTPVCAFRIILGITRENDGRKTVKIPGESAFVGQFDCKLPGLPFVIVICCWENLERVQGTFSDEKFAIDVQLLRETVARHSCTRAENAAALQTIKAKRNFSTTVSGVASATSIRRRTVAGSSP